MAEERERNKSGKIRGFFENGNVGRDPIFDKMILTNTIHDDMIDRGFKIDSVSIDETGHFMTVVFGKRD